MATRKIIPDLAVWSQCFSLYVAVLAAHQPRRVPEMTAYQTIISKASQKYRWLSWVIYDQNFCQDAAENPSQSWAKVVPRLYTQCYTGQAVSAENWSLLRFAFFLCHVLHSDFCHNIPGVVNIPADALSHNNLDDFFASSPKVSPHPTMVSQQLWSLVVEDQPDWLTNSWRNKLSSFSKLA